MFPCIFSVTNEYEQVRVLKQLTDNPQICNVNMMKKFKTIKNAFTCNRDEISSRDETRLGMKKILFTREFHSGMKRVEFHPGMKFNLNIEEDL